MNFFEQQDRAHRNTRQLIVLQALAVVSLVAITTLLIATVIYFNNSSHTEHLSLWQGILHSISLDLFAAISIGVCSVIFLGSLYKYIQFSSGGQAVAEAMGGRLLNLNSGDADERKILNVVEEMAIASGTSVPQVYLLDDPAINAFAAGHSPQDAVIGITRGCIQLLSRDELQGVVAHEFSHIFHGDMKLNMQLLALLNGILLLGLSGEFLIRSTHRTAFYSSKNKSPSALLMLGMGLVVIGYSGTFFGNLIKAAVSRQREFLADASAVKFTRNPEGIAGALKKIGGYGYSSQLQHDNAAEFSHMYFSQGLSDHFLQLLATHPPLEQRIKRIEPRWDGDYPSLDKTLSETTQDKVRNPLASPNYEPIEFAVNLDQVIASIAQPGAAHLDYARQTINAIEGEIHDYSHNPWDAQALMLGLLLASSDTEQQQQWQLLGSLFSAAEIAALRKPAKAANLLIARLRLPLLELSLPTLKQLSPQQYQRFKQALTLVIRADNQVSLLEWSFYRILIHNLEHRAPAKQQLDLAQLQAEASILLSAIAHAGSASETEARTAFDHSKVILGFNAAQLLLQTDYSISHLNRAVSRLNTIKPLQKPRLLKALGDCILKDGKITSHEAELFRAIADSLDCPIPPFLAAPDSF